MASCPRNAATDHAVGRRCFLKQSVGAGTLALLGGSVPAPHACAEPGQLPAVEARHYKVLENGSVQCQLEPRECVIGNGERGFCGVRENRDRKYYSLTYGRPCSVRVARVEETFMHVLPGTKALHVGTAGCNLQCQFCNTWHISQARPEDTPNQSLTPEQLVERAKEEDCASICFTDNEPVVCFEYMLDTAKAARKAGLKITCHTAGQVHEEPAKEMASVLDAVTLDLKAATNEHNEELTVVKLDPIVETLGVLAKSETFLEVASPLIPKYNSPPKFADTVSKFILDAGGPNVPWQLLRYFPSYNMLDRTDVIATPLSMMEKTKELGQAAGLKHVYLCNVRIDEGQNVKCPKCDTTTVTREWGEVECDWKTPGICPKCNTKIRGVWT